MITTRAKLVCTDTTAHSWSATAKTYRFEVRYDPSLPEDVGFATATPTGHLEMLVDAGVEFELGASFYLDITQVEEPANV